MHVVDGKQNLGSELVALYQVGYVGLAVVHAGTALAPRLKGFQLLLLYRVLLLVPARLSVQDQSLLGLRCGEGVVYLECFESVMEGMLHIMKLSLPSQNQP